jgi:hypothetical protein
MPKKNIGQLKTTMVKLARGGRHVILEDILGHWPASVPAVLLDTGGDSQDEVSQDSSEQYKWYLKNTMLPIGYGIGDSY